MRRADILGAALYIDQNRFSGPIIRPGATARNDRSALIPALETAAARPAATGRFGAFAVGPEWKGDEWVQSARSGRSTPTPRSWTISVSVS